MDLTFDHDGHESDVTPDSVEFCDQRDHSSDHTNHSSESSDQCGAFSDQSESSLDETIEILTDDAKLRVWCSEEKEENEFNLLSRSKGTKPTNLNLDLLGFLVNPQRQHLPFTGS